MGVPKANILGVLPTYARGGKYRVVVRTPTLCVQVLVRDPGLFGKSVDLSQPKQRVNALTEADEVVGQ